ncbi:MAG: hypothetical protein BGO45_00650 [Microbacterium sp. 71-36]|uniref:hypothetical protein n=1 Tax=unclassified Microbacterium TaxID=2609290 RepID=UPI00086AF90B|nr:MULTISPECIES: hypothetical protein [unclassified Microbacterium]MBN9210082.1 hypothetical protein [Microbacterium sp.]ODT39797.1 MAG: hypothetical protein ABS60_05745 [Microbacterium sp. SCN 71-17]OJV76111.1 MAG: hypothetical protein BGO45_00650 [Microbacterium sp. 71-36]
MSLRARVGIAVGGVVLVVVVLLIVATVSGVFSGSSVDASSSPAPTGSDVSATPLDTPTPLAPSLTPAPAVPSASASDSPGPAPSATIGTASLILAAWQADDRGISASAFVQDVVEEGGTCVLHARQGDIVRESTAPATPTGQNVSCGFQTIPASELTPGDWTIWFDYSSPTTAATSGAVTLGYGKDQ